MALFIIGFQLSAIDSTLGFNYTVLGRALSFLATPIMLVGLYLFVESIVIDILIKFEKGLIDVYGLKQRKSKKAK